MKKLYSYHVLLVVIASHDKTLHLFLFEDNKFYLHLTKRFETFSMELLIVVPCWRFQFCTPFVPCFPTHTQIIWDFNKGKLLLINYNFPPSQQKDAHWKDDCDKCSEKIFVKHKLPTTSHITIKKHKTIQKPTSAIYFFLFLPDFLLLPANSVEYNLSHYCSCP